jgi:phospholipid/cholesterol/gamma-HCH transport system substrate-binding protein
MRATGIKLSIFTVFTIFVTFGLASIIGNIQFFRADYSIDAVFTDATGVLKGDLVKVAGVNVGKVTSFEVEGGEAIVSLQIKEDVKVPENVLVEIKFRNLLGQRTINLIRPDNPSSDFLEDGESIPVTQTRPALDLSVLFNNLRPLIQSTNPEDINTVARAVLEVFKGREGQFADTLGNLGELADTLAGRDDRLARLITDLGDMTDILNGQSSSIRTGVNRFTEFMESLAEVTPTIERVVDQLDDASTKFGGILARNRLNLDQELNDLRIVLEIVDENLGPLSRIAKNLKEILLSTARTQGYGKWWNLYLINFCPELGGQATCSVEDLP